MTACQLPNSLWRHSLKSTRSRSIDLSGREPSCVPAILKKLHAGSLSDEVYRFRFGRQWSPISISDALEGGGFEISNRGSGNGYLATKVVPTLPDSVAAEMLVLFVGLNPSPSSVEHGYAFAGKSNRFWPAVYEAGIVSKVRDPIRILETDHVGMTDLAKRATSQASAISANEYKHGFGRLDRLCGWLSPRIVCVLGITGWRLAADNNKLSFGEQPIRLGHRPVYVVHNPSGLNTHVRHDDLVAQFQQIKKLAKAAQN